ncbi:MAG: cyclophilin-like fold protein [Burkholderiales bacterium]
MTTKIRIEWPRGAVTLVLEPTPTAARLVAALPFTARAETWGEEVYFTTPVTAKLESAAKQVVPPGTVCFWVDGDALALPYGPTPISKQGESRLVTRCNVLGQVVGDSRALASVRAGDAIRVIRQE